jgi:hypothetical protein
MCNERSSVYQIWGGEGGGELELKHELSRRSWHPQRVTEEEQNLGVAGLCRRWLRSESVGRKTGEM